MLMFINFRSKIKNEQFIAKINQKLGKFFIIDMKFRIINMKKFLLNCNFCTNLGKALRKN